MSWLDIGDPAERSFVGSVVSDVLCEVSSSDRHWGDNLKSVTDILTAALARSRRTMVVDVDLVEEVLQSLDDFLAPQTRLRALAFLVQSHWHAAERSGKERGTYLRRAIQVWRLCRLEMLRDT